MFEFLTEMFGDGFHYDLRYTLSCHTPAYVKKEYKTYRIAWSRFFDTDIILLRPRFAVRGQADIAKIQEDLNVVSVIHSTSNRKCALYLDTLSRSLQKSLIHNGTPFIVDDGQIFLPFWACRLTKIIEYDKMATYMAPGTQLVFLFLSYNVNEGDKINQKSLTHKLGLSKPTVSRAVSFLSDVKLITIDNEGTNTWLSPACSKSDFIKRGFNMMKSPISDIIYVRNLNNAVSSIENGIIRIPVGLNENNTKIAITRDSSALVNRSEIISAREYAENGGVTIEIWKYDPSIITGSGMADELSILAAYQDSDDPDVQEYLDSIREKYGIPDIDTL